MDMAANPDEVRLRKGSSLRERLIWAGGGALVLLILVPGLLTWASGGPPLVAAFLAVPVGLFLIGVAALERNVAWIITRDGILIGEQRPFGQVRKRQIDNHDIADVCVRRNRFSAPRSFSLVCRLVSGNVLISPPLPDITRVNETGATVAQLLGLPERLVDHNDAVSAEVAKAMAEGALRRCEADIALSATGFAGPAGDGCEEGLVFMACARRGQETIIEERHFGSIGRGPVRIEALKVLIDMMEQAIEAA